MPVSPVSESVSGEGHDEAFVLLGGVDSAVVVTDGRAILYANRAASRFLGELRSSPPVSIDSVISRVHQEDRDQFRGLFEATASTGGEASWRTVRIVCPDGGETSVRVSVAEIAYGGRSLHVCTMQDVDATAFPARNSSVDEKMLARLVNRFPGLVYRVRPGPQWHMELVSDGCQELTGHAPEDLLSGDSNNYRQMIHPDDRERVMTELQAALDGRRCFQLAYRLIAADQREKWVWEQGVGLYGEGNELLAVEGFVIDITERKRAEIGLREGQRSLAMLVSNLPGMAYRCSHTRDWDMYFVSDGCFDLTGYPSSELLYSRAIAYGDLVHPEDRDGVLEEVETAVAQNRPFRIVYRIITAEGQEKRVWDQGCGVFSGDGPPTELEGFITEITDEL